MNPRWQRLVHAAVAALSVGLFAAGGHLGATALIESQRWKQLEEFAAVALRRSEIAVDFGIAALDELAARGPVSCGTVALQGVRLHVYQRALVKDIRVVDRNGTVLCSAYSETLEFDKVWPTRDQMLQAGAPDMRLFRVEQFFGVALGVMKDVGPDTALVAILGITGSLFDIMPEALHDHSDVVLSLDGDETIAQSSKGDRSAASVVSITAVSGRYPLRATVRVDGGAYAGWNNEPYLPMMAFSMLLGLVFGILLPFAVIRPHDPVAELDKGLATQAFQPYLQPVFDLDSRRIVGAEVLARWVQPDGKVVPPQRFIQLAVDSGRIRELTWQVTGKALAELQPWLKRDKQLTLSINIDPHHFVGPGFVDELRRAVAAARVSPRQIVLELTERAAFEDLDRAARVVETVREHGFKVAIDDVGIGHSGLSHIQRLAANILKIDKFFVDALDRDATANAVVEMLVRLAAELRMRVVAEGIEAEEQITALRACGVLVGQGFLVSPPVPADRFVALLEESWARTVVELPARQPVRAA